jgi:hypothetical protein
MSGRQHFKIRICIYSLEAKIVGTTNSPNRLGDVLPDSQRMNDIGCMALW